MNTAQCIFLGGCAHGQAVVYSLPLEKSKRVADMGIRGPAFDHYALFSTPIRTPVGDKIYYLYIFDGLARQMDETPHSFHEELLQVLLPLYAEALQRNPSASLVTVRRMVG